MAFIARDGESTVYAYKIAKLPNQDQLYLCLNRDCTARMKIAAINSDIKRPYFTTNGTGYAHIPECLYGNSSNGINTRYDESNFHLDNFINNILKKNRDSHNSKSQKFLASNQGSSTDRPIKTLTQLYYFAKQHNPNYKLNNNPLYKLLSDRRQRSVDFFSGRDRFYREVMVEVTYEDLGSRKNSMIVKPLFDPISPPDKGFILFFSDGEIFKKIKDKIDSNKEKPFIVFGYWYGYRCDIHSTKQVAFPSIIE